MYCYPLFCTLLLCLSFGLVSAQVPDAFNYQAVARDAEGNLLANEPLTAVVDIRHRVDGPTIYQEEHNIVTSAYGQIALVIGEGSNPTRDFSTVYWPDFDAHLQITLRFGRQSYSLPPTPLQSAPYAIWSAKPWELGNDEVLYYLNGPVGIGTESPQAMLEISTDDDTSLRLSARGFGGGNPGLELVRGGTGNGTDWRMRNDGGVLAFETTLDNFSSTGEPILNVFQNGFVGIGTEAPQAPLHLRQANAGIKIEDNAFPRTPFLDFVTSDDSQDFRFIANRNGFDDYLSLATNSFNDPDNFSQRLFTVTEDGEVAIGDFTEPEAELHLRGAGNQALRLESTGENGTEIEFLSHNRPWRLIGFNSFFSLRTTDGGTPNETIFIVGHEPDEQFRLYREMNMQDERIVNMAPPTGPQHAVNRRYLEDYVEQELEENRKTLHPEGMSIGSSSTIDFRDCAIYCRNLTEGGHSDWTMPSMAQAVHFIGTTNATIWTSSPADTQDFWTLSLNSANNLRRFVTDNAGCRCVR